MPTPFLAEHFDQQIRCPIQSLGRAMETLPRPQTMAKTAARRPEDHSGMMRTGTAFGRSEADR